MSSDYEHRELENKIHELERKVNDLDYDLRQLGRKLESEIYRKADKDHSHEGGTE